MNSFYCVGTNQPGTRDATKKIVGLGWDFEAGTRVQNKT